MKRLLLGLLTVVCLVLRSRAAADTTMQSLIRAIEQAPAFDAAKISRIALIRQTLYPAGKDPAGNFAQYQQLYEEYKVFNYDSAYRYAGEMQKMAWAINDPQLITTARLKSAFILLSAGLYTETYDTLRSISIKEAPDSTKAAYYTLMARYFYDMGAYDADKFYSVKYDTAGTHYMDSALAFYPAGSFEKIYYSGLKRYKQGDTTAGGAFFEQLMAAADLSDHQLAVTASTLSGVFLRKGDIDKAMDLLARAAMADIRTATKETFAIFNLAELLYKKGDVRYASICVENAIANAEYYNARQRKAQVSNVLSIIENQRIHAIEGERRLAIQYGIAVTLFLAVLAILIVVIRKQVKKLQAAKKIITEAHALQQQINDKLEEANKIKEEYIGYFFKLDSEYFARLERLKKMIEQKLADRKYEDIRFVLNNIHPRKEKEELLGNFDKVFLRIFPHFVPDFNSFFKEEDRIRLADNELLNTDLRIFALIRIGITDNEKIAEILEYSVNTIYAYKTRIKNKSFLPNEDFEARVMEIKSV
jgi:Domain of unknown function (DUF6377)